MLPITFIFLTFLSRLVLYTSAAPTGHSRRNIISPKELSFLVAALSICLLLAFLLLAKCIFLARRRKPLRGNESWAFKQKRLSLNFLKSEESLTYSSPPSLLRRSEGLNAKVADMKDSKSAFFIGLFGSPSWETRYSNVIPDNDFAQSQDSRYFSVSSLEEICVPIFRPLSSKIRNERRRQRLSARSFVPRYYNRARKLGISDVDSKRRPSSQLVRSSRNISAKRCHHYLSRNSTEFGLLPTRTNNENYCSGGISTSDSPRRRPRLLEPDSNYLGTEINVPEPVYMPYGGDKDKRGALVMHDALGIKQGNKTIVSDHCDTSENTECREAMVNSTTYPNATGEPFTNSSVLKLEGPHMGAAETNVESIDINPFDVDLQPTLVEAHNDNEHSEQQSFIDEKITPILPLNPIKYRTRIRSSDVDRVIRSPKHGPSPLRNVFIPTDEQVSPHITGHTLDFFSEEQPLPASCSSFSNVLLELDDINARGRKLPRRDGTPSRLGDNCLTTFLEELIAETSAWDESLFVDENFKAMVAMNTAPTPKEPLEEKTTSDGDSGRRQVSFINLEDIPGVDGKVVFFFW